MKKTVLIMAGGRGERFWPKSRKGLPKQFLRLTDDGKTMIQLTVERIQQLVKVEDIYISTNTEYKNIVLDQLPEIPEENLLCEPIGRNTAPCIGLGAVHVAEKYNDAVMIVLPSDHLIYSNDIFLNSLKEGCRIAEKNENIVTLGIKPTYPETGYGYVKFNSSICDGNAFGVDCFVEKPNKEMAKEYLKTNKYLWNSGMFIWKVSTILNKIERFLPEIYFGLKEIRNAIGKCEQNIVLEKEFYHFKSESIDYGILEKSDNIYIIPSAFGWDDVGSWIALERIKKSNEDGNVIDGNIITTLSKNNIIQGGEKLIALVGIENMIVIDTEDVTLICDKNCTEDIKKILSKLKDNKDEYI